MRNGVLLAEDTPDNIMQRYEVSTVEEAFLILSQKQGVNDEVDNKQLQLPPNLQKQSALVATGATALEIITSNDSCTNLDLNSNNIIKQINSSHLQDELKDAKAMKECGESKNSAISWWTMTRGRLKALMVKNFIQLFRQPS